MRYFKLLVEHAGTYEVSRRESAAARGPTLNITRSVSRCQPARPWLLVGEAFGPAGPVFLATKRRLHAFQPPENRGVT